MDVLFMFVVCRKSAIFLLLIAVVGVIGVQLSFTAYVCRLKSVVNAGVRLVFNFSVMLKVTRLIHSFLTSLAFKLKIAFPFYSNEI